jgi:hypothetical protein
MPRQAIVAACPPSRAAQARRAGKATPTEQLVSLSAPGNYFFGGCEFFFGIHTQKFHGI